MIFVTAGSMLPFDRLFQIVDEAIVEGLVPGDVFGQIGEGKYEPKYFKFTRFLDKETYDRHIDDAELVIGHAGIGVITQSLQSGTPLLVLARRPELGEHVNDHQIATARKFEEQGHVISFEANNLNEKLTLIKDFIPKKRAPNVSGIGQRIADFLLASIPD